MCIYLKRRYRELYEKPTVVGSIALKSRSVSAYLTAPLTAVNDHEALFGVGLCADGSERSPTFVCSVTGIYVNVYRPQTKGAVIS